MNGEFNKCYLPYGFSSFIDMAHFLYGPSLGIDMMENRLNEAEMNKYIVKKIAEFKKAESKADKIALELAAEEELEKVKEEMESHKKERKSERKKRQRHRRKWKKQDLVEKTLETEQGEEEKEVVEEEVEEELDINSAFVTNVAEKILNCKQIQKSNTSKNEEKKTGILMTDKHPVTVLAFDGFNFAREGCFNDAISKFSEALILTSDDYRLYANRSLCYLQIGQYRKALEDAENCVLYAPEYSKGYFRMGEAYLGLNDFSSAEKAFEQVLKLDPNCQEAVNDLFFIRMKKLMDMGFSKKKATSALHKMKTLNAAVDFLLNYSGNSDDEEFANESSKFESTGDSEVFLSDGEEEGLTNETPENKEIRGGECDDCSEAASSIISSVLISDHTSAKKDPFDPYMDPKNPYHCTKLFVGDVSNRIKKKLLELTFSRFGDLLSVKMLPSTRCAIVTFKDWRSAGPAMERLQNWSLLPGTPPIIIKYPASDLQRLSGGSLPLNHETDLKTDHSIGSTVPIGRDDWCSQTMPPPSPAPSLSSVKSTYSQAVLRSPPRKSKIDPAKDPSNPRCGSLYIGNIVQKVKERDLLPIFSKYGPVISIRVIPEKKCAFVNYSNNNSAGLAMSRLQGKSLFPGSPPVTIKYPSKAVNSIDPRSGQPSTSGQVIGDECYNWRTLGCPLGNRCPNKHIPEHKGIALHHKAVHTLHY